jgi:cell division protein FtsA
VVGLDIGTTKVCCLVGEATEQDTLNIVGIGEAPSDGMRKGVVVNIEKTVKAIRAAVQAAELMAGHKIDSAYVGLAGNHLLSQNSRGMVAVARSDREIVAEDIARVMEAARAVSVPSDREIIHVVPRGYVVDGQEGVKDAVGMAGQRLEVETHIITGAMTAVQNVVKCVHNAGLNIDDVVMQALASAEAVLSDNEIELGVALVDIGGSTTDLAVFSEGSVLHSAVIPVGGAHVTNDIAIGLRTSVTDAETAKINYGHTMPFQIPGEELIELRQIGSDRLQSIPRRHLAEIIAPRAREIMSLVRAEIRRSGHDRLLPAGAVLTGGGARLMGAVDIGQSVLDLPVRVGLPTGCVGMSEKVSGPSYATAVGLLKWGIHADELDGHRNGAGKGAMQDLYGRTVRWFREFF